MRIVPFTFDSLVDEGPEEQQAHPPQLQTGEQPPEEEEAPPPLTFTEEQLAAEQQKSYDEGFIAGKSEGLREAQKAQQEDLKETNALLHKMQQQLDSMDQQFKQNMHAQQQDLSKIVLACAQRVAGEALLQNPANDIETLIEQCLSGLFDSPDITAKLHPEVAALLKEKLPKNITIEEDTNINPADFSLHWTHGIAQRNTDDLWKEIDVRIQRYFHGQDQQEVTTNKAPSALPVEEEPTIAEEIETPTNQNGESDE